MHVTLAADAEFAMPLAVTLASLSHSQSEEIEVTVFHDDLAPATIARIEAGLGGRLAVRWHRVDPAQVAGAHYSTFLTRASLFRLLLPRLLPDLDRVLYLDCDIVVTASLRPLWETDLDGALLGAVRDAGSPFPAGPLGTDWRGLGLDPATPYFNTGMLLIPLEEWRRQEVSERALSLLRRRQPRWGDQDGLNAVVDGRWVELPRRWNLQSPDALGTGLAWALWREDVELALRDPAVVHYTDRDKPWMAGCEHPLAQHWYRALEGSDWSGWRPRHPRRRRLARIAAGARALPLRYSRTAP
ncbi:MAG TPA: glycosyltransferase family 8 protein [Solirubrobacterales bacterium]|nr:glycosyltransferase family 8 protein [Solirubrobacterales bacterium]